MIILIETEAHQLGQSECLKTEPSGCEVKVRLLLQAKDYTPKGGFVF
jgi:hypothetical protein